MGNFLSTKKKKTKSPFQKLFDNYFEFLSTAVILVNREGNIIACNQNLIELIGYSKKLLIGQNISLLIPPHFQKQHQTYLQNFNFHNKQSRLMGKSRPISIVTETNNLLPVEITLDTINLPDSQDYILIFLSEITHDTRSIDNLQYKIFFDVCNEMFCIASTDGYFLKTNKAFTTILGYSESELKEVSFLDFVHPDDRDATTKQMQYLNDNNIVCNFDNRYRSKCGEYKSLRWRSYPYNGLVYATAFDITKDLLTQHLLYEKDLLFEEAEKLAKFGCWKWDVISKDLFWTNGLKCIYDFDPSKPVTFDQYINYNHSDDRDFISQTIQQCLQTKQPYEFIHRIGPDSNIRYLFARGKYITIGERDYIIGVGQDITKTIHTQQELKEARQIAEKSSDLKSIFLANMSHEIRTPINGVVGMTSLLQTTQLTPEQKEYIDVISNSCGILLSLINNILDLARIESHIEKVNLDVGNLEELIAYINNTMKPLALKKSLIFQISSAPNTPLHIRTDIVKLNQIISNLINNSIKFTNYGSIKLDIHITNNSGTEVLVLQVQDTGIGILEEDQKKLFTPFSQVDSSTTKEYGGTGLGLSICKKLTDLLGGTIKITSIPNKGTTVSLLLPFTRLDNLFLKYVPDKHPIVVIVEDNKSNQIVLKKFLEKLGFHSILLFNNGSLALQGLYNTKPDIVFMDLHMPIMNGYDCTKQLRAIGITCPIIAVTANIMNDVKDNCLKSGMNDFITKPFVLSDMSTLINKWLT